MIRPDGLSLHIFFGIALKRKSIWGRSVCRGLLLLHDDRRAASIHLPAVAPSAETFDLNGRITSSFDCLRQWRGHLFFTALMEGERPLIYIQKTIEMASGRKAGDTDGVRRGGLEVFFLPQNVF
ncbi:hypothetical protein AVEN_242690-1 [Araneus ventricosus]|uniref:Uncharacterized protein n=1 Tax=Araneus ventricosus TaxID=182803 RepID=A0A4Y2E111_ARAVE|nr:hypothetical protein AVEN_242690-1 [Araneus ventricosus]